MVKYLRTNSQSFWNKWQFNKIMERWMSKYLSGWSGLCILQMSLLKYSLYNGRITNKSKNWSWIIDLCHKRQSFIICMTSTRAEIEALCAVLLSWARHDHGESKDCFCNDITHTDIKKEALWSSRQGQAPHTHWSDETALVIYKQHI